MEGRDFLLMLMITPELCLLPLCADICAVLKGLTLCLGQWEAEG